MSSELVRYTQEDGTATIQLCRLEKLNALNLAIKREIEACLTRAGDDPSVMSVILTGGNDVFVAGTDIAEMRDMSATQHLAEKSDGVFVALRECDKITIAAVEGYALGGGCELALGCDMIVAGRSAQFGQPEIRVGIMPGAGGTQFLLRAVGKYRAMHMALTGERIPAEKAEAMGLVSELVEPGQALDRARQLGRAIAQMPPIAVRSIKEAIKMGQEMTLGPAVAAERNLFRLLFETRDQKEGMDAFLAKRRPRYTGS